MPFPEPYAGLVIRYSYLWKREQEAGREEGTKDRPCAVVMAIMDQDGEWEVLVLPITHSPPDPADAIEIPTATKKRLGLDTDRFIELGDIIATLRLKAERQMQVARG